MKVDDLRAVGKPADPKPTADAKPSDPRAAGKPASARPPKETPMASANDVYLGMRNPRLTRPTGPTHPADVPKPARVHPSDNKPAVTAREAAQLAAQQAAANRPQGGTKPQDMVTSYAPNLMGAIDSALGNFGSGGSGGITIGIGEDGVEVGIGQPAPPTTTLPGPDFGDLKPWPGAGPKPPAPPPPTEAEGYGLGTVAAVATVAVVAVGTLVGTIAYLWR